MTAVICLLRGVNVGGHNMIKMDVLRALCESIGHLDVQTYVQSGNVVFQTKDRDAAKLAATIEDAIEKKHGFRPDVILRTAAEMREVIARNPFAKRKDIEPGKLIVTFLDSEPAAETKVAILALKPDPEEIRMNGRELYVCCWKWRRSWRRAPRSAKAPASFLHFRQLGILRQVGRTFEVELVPVGIAEDGDPHRVADERLFGFDSA
jgi:uncharacterized protein (DUF1697 family)